MLKSADSAHDVQLSLGERWERYRWYLFAFLFLHMKTLSVSEKLMQLHLVF